MSHLPQASVDSSVARALPSAAALRERDQRLESLKVLVGHLAHDFNNCLAPLVGYLTLLREELPPGVPGDQYVSKLDGSVRKTEGLVQSILQATHPERQFCPKSVDFTLLLQGSLEDWMKSLPSTLQISVESALVPCALWLDENLWTKAIQHLLRNAQAALSHSGTLRVSLQRREFTGEDAAQLSLGDTSVFELTVEDSGCGMSDEVLNRAFDPLFSTRPNAVASGLGLTLVHSVVQLHGGQLAIDSTGDAGTCVRIWLPASGS